MTEVKNEKLGENWVVFPDDHGPLTATISNTTPLNEAVVVAEEEIQRAPTVVPKKKRGYSFWRYFGWRSSSSTKSHDNIPKLEDYTAGPSSYDDNNTDADKDCTPAAVIHDHEMLASLQHAAVDVKDVENVDDENPPTPRNSIACSSNENNDQKLKTNVVYPVDKITTENELFNYLDQVIESLRKDSPLTTADDDDNLQTNFDNKSEIPTVTMPEIPVVSENASAINTNATISRIRLENEAKVLAFLEQLAVELETDQAAQAVVALGAYGGEHGEDEDTYSDMPELISASSSSYSSSDETDSDQDNDCKNVDCDIDTEELFKVDGDDDDDDSLVPGANVSNSSYTTPSATTHLTEIVIESPQSPIPSRLLFQAKATQIRRRRFTRRRPPTPFSRRKMFGNNSNNKRNWNWNDAGETDEDQNNNREPLYPSSSSASDVSCSPKRVKMSDSAESANDIHNSLNSSEILSKMERGELLSDSNQPFATVRVVRTSHDETIVDEKNRYHELLDRICPPSPPATGDVRLNFSDDVSISSSTGEEISTFQAIAEEFSELADSVSRFFRRSSGCSMRSDAHDISN